MTDGMHSESLIRCEPRNTTSTKGGNKRDRRSRSVANMKETGKADAKKPAVSHMPPRKKQRTEENGLRVIEPNYDDPVALKILECFDSYLSRHRRNLRIRLHNWAHTNSVQGVRLIQNGRFEIFLQAQGKESAVFDTLVKEMQDEILGREPQKSSASIEDSTLEHPPPSSEADLVNEKSETPLAEGKVENEESALDATSAHAHAAEGSADGARDPMNEESKSSSDGNLVDDEKDTPLGDGKGSNVEDSVMEKVPAVNGIRDAVLVRVAEMTLDEIRLAILGYAQAQARKDPRIADKYVFDNYSFLVNFSACAPQLPHIDLLHPNVQCGLCLTDKSPATLTYDPKKEITSVDALKKHLWKDLPMSLEKAMRDNVYCSSLLGGFGSTLASHITEYKQKSLMRRGSVVTLPGGVIHAGPKTNGYRCILFFSGWRRGSRIDGYNPDTQYFQSMLCADMYTILRKQLSIKDRVYLLNKLGEMIQKYKHLHRHLTDDLMKKFTNALAHAQYPKGGKEVFLRVFAETEEIISKSTNLDDYQTKPSSADDPDLRTLVSAKGLETDWDGTFYALEVYRLLNDPERVVIYYPTENEWEGKIPGERYTLTMKGRSTSTRRFDGKNGTLMDKDGEEIKCFVKQDANDQGQK